MNFSERQTDLLVSVFFCGTSGSIEAETTQIGIFAKECSATDITPPRKLPDSVLNKPFKFMFDGCGVTDGVLGMVFAKGLNTQCSMVVATLKQLLRRAQLEAKANNPPRLVLNCLGLSRGGMACMMLAKLLASWSNVQINCCLFDPVPGNSITGSSYVDLFGVSLANQCLSLRECATLDRVLAIYPFEPLPDVTLHAPILPEYPKSARVLILRIDSCL
eukprot:gb/GEZN01011163.1/.p1 GENE.gb/GEZN01011163.1/~~gb/GEZN01011163.1/.p1  ORF type:complete len:218 (-),score=24.64 gb/GEZN01011163.1/:54-707(-)